MMNEGTSTQPAPVLQRLASVTMIFVACVALVATGLVGVGRSAGRFGVHDFVYIYAAGDLWRKGVNPYDTPTFIAEGPSAFSGSSLAGEEAKLACSFAYPPTASTPAALLSFTGADAARVIFGGMNVLAALAVALGCTKLVRPQLRAGLYAPLCTGAVLAMALGSPFVSHNIWMGQTSLLVTGLLVTAELARRKSLPVVGSALAACSTIKPTAGVFYILDLMLERKWKVIAALGVVGLGISAVALAVSGPLETPRTWLAAVKEYQGTRQNLPEFRHSFGVRSVLAQAGIAVPSLTILGFVVFGALYALRRRFTPFELFSAGLVVSLLFVHAHDYDLVAAAPFFAALLAMNARSFVRICIVGACVAAMYMPLQLVLKSGVPMLGRYREFLLAGMFVWFVVSALRRADVPGAAALDVTRKEAA